MANNFMWYAPSAELLKCPVPGCGHIGSIITKAHCRLEHSMTREEVGKKYGMPTRILTYSENQNVDYGGKTPDRIEVIIYDIISVLEMRKVFGSMRLQDVIKAISDGYEIKKTPEDEILETYQAFGRKASNYDAGFNDGIRFVLNTLGIKIKGVNQK